MKNAGPGGMKRNAKQGPRRHERLTRNEKQRATSKEKRTTNDGEQRATNNESRATSYEHRFGTQMSVHKEPGVPSVVFIQENNGLVLAKGPDSGGS